MEIPDLDDLLSRARQAEADTLWSKAATIYESVQGQIPENSKYEIQERLLWCLSRDRQYSKAIALARTLTQDNPRSAKFPYMVGYQYHEQKMWQQAIEWYDKALVLKPDYIVVLYRKGYAHAQLGQIQEAIQSLEGCRNLWSKLPEGPNKQRDKQNYVKACYYQAKLIIDNPNKFWLVNIEDVIRILEEAIKFDPEDANKHYLIGKYLSQKGHFEQSLSYFARANKLLPKKDYVLDQWAQAYKGLDRNIEALDLYLQLPLYRQKAYYLKNLGSLYLDLGNIEKAISVLKMAIDKDHKDHKAHYFLAVGYKRQGQLALAAKELKIACKQKEQRFSSAFKEAEQILEELLAENPSLLDSADGKNCGRIIKYFADKGFGFIKTDDDDDLFFHIRNCSDPDQIRIGLPVKFTLGNGRKGLEAYGVSKQ